MSTRNRKVKVWGRFKPTSNFAKDNIEILGDSKVKINKNTYGGYGLDTVLAVSTVSVLKCTVHCCTVTVVSMYTIFNILNIDLID